MANAAHLCPECKATMPVRAIAIPKERRTVRTCRECGHQEGYLWDSEGEKALARARQARKEAKMKR